MPWTEIKRSQREIRELISNDLSRMASDSDSDSERLKYVLQSGKRVHSMIALSIMGEEACLATEYLHTVSALSRNVDTIRGLPHATTVYSPHVIAHITAVLTMKACEHAARAGLSLPIFNEVLCLAKLEVLSPRERRARLMRYIHGECGLFQFCFGDINVGQHFGLCYVLTGLVNSQDLSGLLHDCFTHNELIDMFTEHIELYARVMTETQRWTPVLRELYNYVLLNFKKGIKSWVN